MGIIYDQFNQIEKDLSNTNINDQIKELEELIQTLIDIIDGIASAKVLVKEHEIFTDTLLMKSIYHFKSLVRLLKGDILYVDKTKVPIIDIPTCFIISRAIIETYVTFNYIYVAPKSEEERFFKFSLWKISALINRQGTKPLSVDSMKWKEEEKRLIDQLKIKLQNDPFYSELDRNQKRNLEKYGLPRINSWMDLITQSGLGDLFLNCYQHFSQYAHSEFISVNQIKQGNYLNVDTNKSLITDGNLCISISKILVSKSILELITLVPIGKIIYNTSSGLLITKINMLAKMGQRKL